MRDKKVRSRSLTDHAGTSISRLFSFLSCFSSQCECSKKNAFPTVCASLFYNTMYTVYSLLKYTTMCIYNHRLNMELDLQSLFGLLCTVQLYSLAETPPPPSFGLIYECTIGQPRQTASLCNPLCTVQRLAEVQSIKTPLSTA